MLCEAYSWIVRTQVAIAATPWQQTRLLVGLSQVWCGRRILMPVDRSVAFFSASLVISTS